MTNLKEIAGALLIVPLLAFQALVFTSSSGIVHEHCLAKNAQSIRDVESGWTYVMWPPLVLAHVDPPGRCVRNSVGREVLSLVGIWPLGTPSEQVEAHLRSQGEKDGSDRLLTLLEPSTGEPRRDKELVLRQLRTLIQEMGYPPDVKRCVMRAARRIPAEQLGRAAGGADETRVAAAMDRAWSRCLPPGQSFINPKASDEAIEFNKWLIASAIASNMEQAGASESTIECVTDSIRAIERAKLIELAGDQSRFARHLKSIVSDCGG